LILTPVSLQQMLVICLLENALFLYLAANQSNLAQGRENRTNSKVLLIQKELICPVILMHAATITVTKVIPLSNVKPNSEIQSISSTSSLRTSAHQQNPNPMLSAFAKFHLLGKMLGFTTLHALNA